MTRALGNGGHHNDLIDAGMRSSRYHFSVVVAERACFKGLAKVLDNKGTDRVVALASQLNAGFVVIAGQLHKGDTGCLGMVINDPANLELLESSVVGVYGRLTALGETASMWFTALEGEARARIEHVLGKLGATEGTA